MIDRLSLDMVLQIDKATTSLVSETTTEKASMDTTRLLTSKLIHSLVVDRLRREDKTEDRVEDNREEDLGEEWC